MTRRINNLVEYYTNVSRQQMLDEVRVIEQVFHFFVTDEPYGIDLCDRVRKNVETVFKNGEVPQDYQEPLIALDRIIYFVTEVKPNLLPREILCAYNDAMDTLTDFFDFTVTGV